MYKINYMYLSSFKLLFFNAFAIKKTCSFTFISENLVAWKNILALMHLNIFIFIIVDIVVYCYYQHGALRIFWK